MYINWIPIMFLSCSFHRFNVGAGGQQCSSGLACCFKWRSGGDWRKHRNWASDAWNALGTSSE